MVLQNSNHGAVLNSPALALAGYDASTPDPAGGVIVRRPGSTEPAGLVMETAFIPLFVHMPRPGPPADPLPSAPPALLPLNPPHPRSPHE
jgi:predicted amidohydrolase YtcJ